jgi:hypothetical protein
MSQKRKSVASVDVPKDWKAKDDYSSHRPLLYVALSNNEHLYPIAEFGSGYGSTPLIGEYCKGKGLLFESYDNDPEWCTEVGSMYAESYEKIFLPRDYILFIDGKPGEDRKKLLEMNKHKWVLIAHDTEPGAEYVYGMADVLSSFNYRLDFQPEGMPHTTIVSQFVDVTEWA